MKYPKVTPVPSTVVDAPPAGPRWAWTLALVGIAALFLTLSLQRIWASDLWWQLRTGQHILEHGFPTTDALSFTASTRPWIELRWMFCVIVYKLYSIGGPGALIVFESIMLASAFGVYAFSARKALLHPLGTLALALGVMTAYQRFVVRPELFTYLLMAVFVVVLDAARQGRHRRLLWALPALQILWVNSHTLFIFGPVAACAFAGADTLSRWWRILTAPTAPQRAPRRGMPKEPSPGRPAAFDLPLCATTLLVIVACFLNPWGVEGAKFPFLLFEEIKPGHLLARSIEEFTSPFFGGQWAPSHTFGIILAAIGAVTFALNWRRTSLARLALWGAHVYFAATSARNLGIFGFIGAWAALQNIADLCAAGSRPAALFSPNQSLRRAGHVIVAAATLFGAWGILSERLFSQHQEPRPLSFGTMRSITPAGATDFLLASGAKPQLFHSMRDASYLSWKARDHYKVFVDGRLEVYAIEFLKEFLSFLSLDWDAFSRKYAINVVMVNRDEFPLLSSRLALRPEWVLVYLDDIQSVWVRDIPEHAEIIAKFRIDTAKTWEPRGPEPDESISGWRQAIGGRAFPWYTLGMARQFLALGAPENAGIYLERAHAVAPWNKDTRLLLAQIERWHSNDKRADELLAGGNFSRSELAGGDRTLADLYITSGRDKEAIAPLERCLPEFADDPGAHAIYAKLGRAYTAADRFDDAAKAFRNAAQLAPGVPDYQENLAIVLAAKGDLIGAKSAYEAALAIDPRRPDLLTDLGSLLVQLKSPADARKCFEYALKLQPNYERARESLRALTGVKSP